MPPLAPICLVFLCANALASSLSVFFSAFVNERGFSLSTAGIITTAMMAGAALGSICSVRVLEFSRRRVRRVIQISLAILIGTQLLSTTVTSFASFLVLGLLSGIAEGVVQACGAAWIAQNPEPERGFALYMGCTYLSGVIGVPLFSAAESHAGLRGAFLTFAAVLAVGWLIALAYPQLLAESKSKAEPSDVQRSRHHAEYLILASIVVNFAVNGGLWVYLEEVGRRALLSGAQISSVLSAGMAAACVATLTVASVGSHAGRFKALLCAHVLLAAGPVLLSVTSTFAAYTVGVLLFHVGFSVVSPFLLGLLTDIDPSGRAAMRGIAATNVGFIAGPLVISQLVLNAGYDAALAACAALFLGCALLIVIGRGMILSRARNMQHS